MTDRDPHEVECALAALALLIERARNRRDRSEERECLAMYREYGGDPRSLRPPR